MKTSGAGRMRVLLLCGVLAGGLSLRGQEEGAPLINQSREEAIRRLGPMRGSAVFDQREILQFDRGLVELRDGRVVRADIITPEQLAERRAREAAEREAAVKAQQQAAARRKAEGEALIRRFKEDFNFASKPAAERVIVWREIAGRYPEAVNDDLRTLLLAAESEAEKNKMEQRIAQLEFLAWEANRKAEAAKEEASRPKVIYHGYDPFFGRYYLNTGCGVLPYGRPWVRSTHPGSSGFYGPGGYVHESFGIGTGIQLRTRSGSVQGELRINNRSIQRP